MEPTDDRLQRPLRIVVLALGVALVAAQLTTMLLAIDRLTVDRGTLLGADADSERFLRIVEQSAWFRKVSSPYDELYYRVAASLQQLDMTSPDHPQTPAQLEQRERSYLFVMYLLAAIPVLLLGLLLAFAVSRDPPVVLALGGLLSWALMTTPMFARYALRAYPESFVAILVALGVFGLLRIERDGNRFRQPAFYGAALLLGAACSTKPNAIQFAIAAFLLVAMPSRRSPREWLRRGVEALAFGAVMLATYMVTSAPESLHLVQRYRGLTRFVGSNSAGFDLGWVGHWTLHWLEHLWLPALALALGMLLFWEPPPEERPRRLGDSGWSVLVVAIPLALVLRTRYLNPTQHYVLSIIGASLLVEAFLLQRLLGWLHRRAHSETGRKRLWTRRADPRFRHLATLVVLALVALLGPVPDAVAERARSSTACFGDARQVIETIRTLRPTPDAALAATPYFPLPTELKVKGNWRLQERDVAPPEVTLLGIAGRFSRQFTGTVSEWYKHQLPWQEMQPFFRAFAKKDGVATVGGKRWERVLDTKCGYQLWRATGVAEVESEAESEAEAETGAEGETESETGAEAEGGGASR